MIRDKDFIIAEGTLPVCLIAHLDTISEDVFKKQASPCLYDAEDDILHVIGGNSLDDRLGVAMILDILDAGFLPSIIFTTGEEIGGLGAYEIVTRFPQCPLKNVNFMIELDRHGYDDAVYYTCGNKNFQKYINSFGFQTAQGSFTDCLILGEEWDIAAVNLSCAYFNEHTIYEYALLKETEKTVEKVKQILSNKNNIKYSYEKKESRFWGNFDFIKK